MTIAFSCPECDKTFKVSDDMAGRKGKCNNCGATMQIPNKIGATAKRGLGRKSTDEPDEDEDWQGEDEPRGRVRRGRDEDDDYEVTRSRRRGRNDEVDDEVDDEIDDDDRPRRRKRRKKKSSSKMALWVSLASAGALLFLGGGYFVLAFAIGIWPFGGPGEAMKFMPDDCKVLISVKWDDIEKSQVFQDLRKSNPDIEKKFGGDAEKAFELFKKKGVDTVLIGLSGNAASLMGGGGSPKGCVVVTFKESISGKECLDAHKDGGSYKENKVGSYTVYEGPTDSFSVVSSKMVVFGDKDVLSSVLKRDKKLDVSERLKAAIDKVNFSKGVAIAADVKDLTPAGSKGPGGAPGGGKDPMAGFQKAGEEVEGMAMQVTVGSDIGIECTLMCKSAKGAEDIKKTAEGLSAMLGFLGGAVPKEAKEILDSLKVNVAGTTVTATLTIKGAAITNLAKNPFMGGGFGGPPGGGFGGPPGGGFNPPAPGGVNPGGNRPPVGPGGVKPPAGPGGNRPPRGGGLRPPNSP